MAATELTFTYKQYTEYTEQNIYNYHKIEHACVGVLVICVLVFTLFCTVCTVFLYCFVYVYLFLFVLSVLVEGLLPPSDNCISINNNNNNNNIFNPGRFPPVAYPGIFSGGRGLARNFFRGGGGFQQIQLRTDGRENGDLGALAQKSVVPLNLQMSETRILIRLLRMYFPRNWEFSSALSKLRNFGV
jgi:hypothetical protein